MVMVTFLGHPSACPSITGRGSGQRACGSVLSLEVVARARRAEHRLFDNREPLAQIGPDAVVDCAAELRVVALKH